MPDGISEVTLAALSASAGDRAMIAFMFIFCALAVLLGMSHVDHAWLIGVGAGALGLAPLLLSVFVFTPRRERTEMRRLRSLPYPFNRDAYLSSLGREASFGHLVVTVAFDADPLAIRAAFEERCRDAGVEKIAWAAHNKKVDLVSKRFATEVRSRGRVRYDNGPVHRCLRHLLTGALADVHAAAGVTSLIAVASDGRVDRDQR